VWLTQTYWLGPLLGGVLAGVIYDLLFAANATCDKAKSLLTDGDYDDSNFDAQGRRDAGEDEASDQPPLKDEEDAKPDYGTMHWAKAFLFWQTRAIDLSL